MTDDELRKAAEKTVYYWCDHEDKMSRAVAEVCKRWLAEHPADDGEPVTADWLRAAGFVKWGERGSMILFHRAWQPGHDDSIEVNAAHQWAEIEHGLDVVRVPNISTRGHVRRLCAALGITLTESGT